MKHRILATAALIAGMGQATMLQAQEQMTDVQKQQIEKIVHDYLVSHPEVLLEASQALQQKQQQDMKAQAQQAIEKNADVLFSDKYTVVGNPKGNVTLVEFFDYQCIHCKKMSPVITELLSKNKNLRVIYKEFPIFGKSSEFASKAALAAAMQGKYQAMHDALLKVNQRLTDDLVLETAKKAGINMDKLKQDMNSKAVSEAVDANRKLAEEMRLMGTPALVVGSTPDGVFKKGSQAQFIPGAANTEVLQGMIESAAKVN